MPFISSFEGNHFEKSKQSRKIYRTEQKLTSENLTRLGAVHILCHTDFGFFGRSEELV